MELKSLGLLLTATSGVLPKKLTGPSQSRNSLHFMEPRTLLPHSQWPTTCPYIHPRQSTPRLPIPILADELSY